VDDIEKKFVADNPSLDSIMGELKIENSLLAFPVSVDFRRATPGTRADARALYYGATCEIVAASVPGIISSTLVSVNGKVFFRDSKGCTQATKTFF
jgi:hypothetical protein